MINQIQELVNQGLAFKPNIQPAGTGTHLSVGSGFAYGFIGLGAGIAMIGAIGSGAGQGIAAGRAAEAVGRNPQAESQIRNMMIIGDGVAASAAIYGLIISLLLIFVF
jgi:F-type H+-transporting ATPase subunit c